ncbi:hypothetical protein CDO44_14055 [Pigmentiphaga sp. NML080357]|uniref:hypothetical protein n=1 Tax=Pigmentiphaga sp. NML080357 TaxID=2008675 RepID=UPI000B417024|nr:hypothetical protein [Pigmentiphaga sp. NML080357]OVZ58819.1 hypothetical protein CDO44_14055 [Pigmentiphaga sp. NML080357]
MSTQIASRPPSAIHPARRLLRAGCRLLAAGALLAAAGCDYLGLQPISQIEARKESEGRAIGSACRQAGRALEDCYTFNPHMSKAAIFNGWKEMNDYMLQNNLTEVRPEVAPVLPAGRARVEGAPRSAPTDMSAAGQPAKPPARTTLYAAP